VLNWLWIGRYGIVGAATATLVSQMVAVWLLTALYPRTRSIFFMQMRALWLWPLAARGEGRG
jgi:Na+-driven multidrug efflux pump